MLTLPLALPSKTEFDQAVSEVVRYMAPDVVYIRHNIAQDWDGDWAIYFRVLLSDEAAKTKLGEITTNVRNLLDQKLDPLSMDLFSYHNFRTVSEQAVLAEESWN